MDQIRNELKEKDMDILELQKEIDELQLENKLLKLKMPFLAADAEHQQRNMFSLPKRDDQLKLETKHHPFVRKNINNFISFDTALIMT